MKASHFYFILKAEHWNMESSEPPQKVWRHLRPGTQPLEVFYLPQVEGFSVCVCVCAPGSFTVPSKMEFWGSISPAKIHTQPGIKRAETYQQVLNALPQSLDQIHHHSRFIFPLFNCPTNSCRIHQAYILIFSVT